MKFFGILLKEGRKEDLKKKYFDQYDEEDLDFILGISDLQDFNHKYTDWVLKHLLEYADVVEVAEIAVDLVKDFDKYQKNLEKKDINQYLSIEELQTALETFKVKEKERELKKQTEKIYEDENFLVLIPKTIEASCKYGSGTKWCTTVKGADHFKRYTSGKQGLYYIIRKKGKQTEPHYKVAVHIGENGRETWYDAEDKMMNSDSVRLFKEYFPELNDSILQNYEKKTKPKLEDLNKIFQKQEQVLEIYPNIFGSKNSDLKISLTGFDLIPDLPGKAMGNLKIYLNDELLDSYDVYVNLSLKNNNQWGASIGFDSAGEFDDEGFEPKYDFNFWKGWGFDGFYNYLNTPDETRNHFLKSVISMVKRKISGDVEFEKYVKNITGPTWRPDRIGYGYTFKENKGLIKKLVDYLDKGYDNGTKLDFLEYVGKLKTKIVNGKKLYAHSYSDKFFPSSQMRGHFASFFASAKHAGIINYVKEGNKFIIKPGPNFVAFKEGKLKAL